MFFLSFIWKHDLEQNASTDWFPVICVSLVEEYRRLCIVGVPQGHGPPNGYPNGHFPSTNGNGFNYGFKFPSGPNGNGNGGIGGNGGNGGSFGGNGGGPPTHQHIGELIFGSDSTR